MGKPLPVEEPIATPEFDELVRELDELLRSPTGAEPRPSIEDLFLARVAGAPPGRRKSA